MRPLIIAHRGNSALAPENTLAAFESAAIAGVDQIEIDIHTNADGDVVVIHDFDVERTSDGSGKLTDLSTHEFARLDAGSWFSPHYGGQKVPLLADVIELGLKYPAVGWLIEFKGVWSKEAVGAVGQALIAAGMQERSVLQSFELETVAAIAELLPQFHRGLLVGALEESTIEIANRYQVHQINPALQYVQERPGSVATLREAGFEVNVWTANTYDSWQFLTDLEVTGIISDWPDRLMGYMAR